MEGNGRIAKIRATMDALDPNLTRVFTPWILRHPGRIPAYLKLGKACRDAASRRKASNDTGTRVPPFLILSVTSVCNLHCAGCFAAAAGTTHPAGRRTGCGGKLDANQWKKVIAQASELGIFGFVIAGGEPFLLPGLLDLVEKYDDRFFIILTNGTVMLPEHRDRLARLANVAVIVSLEGDDQMTDSRRGEGVHEKALQTLALLKRAGVVTGVSATVTRSNFRYWMETGTMDRLQSMGVRLLSLLEYIPNSMDGSDRDFMLDPVESKEFRERVLQFREERPLYIIHSPGDEEFFGGCVSAGRGFAHVTPQGDLTPCPVSNLATHNLTRTPLKEALDSVLFKRIRESEGLLETDGSPCALFAHPEEMELLAGQVGAYRSGATLPL